MAAVLITGGTGYLGQWLLKHFAASGCQVGFTYNSTQPQSLPPGNVRAYKVDLATGEGLAACFQDLTAGNHELIAVINCAAISQPALCERDPEAAAAVNVPTKLLDALDQHSKQQGGGEPLLIHLSTDQVYDGSKSYWREDDECRPMNAYGRTKLAAERLIQKRWRNHAILRSSIIYGPDPPVPVGRTLFLQFIDDSLAAKKPTTFFDDEWRSPLRVRDIVRICQTLIHSQAELEHRLFNMGGPDRLSRADMAEAVAAARGYDKSLVIRASAASVDRGVASPADISMDSSRLQKELDFELTPFATAIQHIFAEHAHHSMR